MHQDIIVAISIVEKGKDSQQFHNYLQGFCGDLKIAGTNWNPEKRFVMMYTNIKTIWNESLTILEKRALILQRWLFSGWLDLKAIKNLERFWTFNSAQNASTSSWLLCLVYFQDIFMMLSKINLKFYEEST